MQKSNNGPTRRSLPFVMCHHPTQLASRLGNVSGRSFVVVEEEKPTHTYTYEYVYINFFSFSPFSRSLSALTMDLGSPSSLVVYVCIYITYTHARTILSNCTVTSSLCLCPQVSLDSSQPEAEEAS